MLPTEKSNMFKYFCVTKNEKPFATPCTCWLYIYCGDAVHSVQNERQEVAVSIVNPS